MKYNSNMKNFKPVVLKNLFAMCGRDEKIPELAKDGSPVQLREHLKEYGKIMKIDNGDDIMYDFSPSRGIKIRLDHQINVDGDNCLELSVSQMATFIRGCVEDGSWKEPNDGENSEQDSAATEPPENSAPGKTYFDALREKFSEIKDCTDEEIDTGTCCVEIYFDVRMPCDGDCIDCWRQKCEADFREEGYESAQEDIEDIIKNHDMRTAGEAVPAETDTQITEVPEMSENKIVSAGDCEKAVPFDYSALDNETAKSLKDCEAVIKKKTAGYFTLLGEKFKEAQNLLASHSAGTFEQWYISIGFKRQTVYRLMQRYDFLSSPTVGERADVFEGLPLTLSYEVSDPKAPAELVDKTLKGEIKTNADFQKLKKELEHAQETVKTLTDESERKTEINKALAEDIDEKRKELEKTKSDLRHELSRNKILQENSDKNNKKISALENQVKELESRPVDVATKEVIVPDPADKEKISALEKRLEQAETAHDGKRPEQLVKDFYETLHNAAHSALVACADFAENPENSAAAGYMAEQFKSLIDFANYRFGDIKK